MFYINKEDRSLPGKIIHANNYEYSHIRAYLNGLDGSAYYVKDFTNKGFINKAFSKKAIEKINIVKLDNSLCNNTKDKIFLLSQSEITKSAYGFASDERRILQPTDYSLATGTFMDLKRCCNWWLRSPYDYRSDYACVVFHDGNADYYYYVDYTNRGVVPALSISF